VNGPNPLKVVSENYGTYVNDVTKTRERHWPRLFLQLGVALSFASLMKTISDDAISVLITSISILIGFAFTALFPIAGDGLGKLSTPIYAEDWDDIKRIKLVVKNFRKNVSYFIPLCLLFILFLFMQMISVEHSAVVYNAIIRAKASFCSSYNCWMDIKSFARVIISSITVFVLLEISYTFYRMCFNALSILRIKDEYEDERMRGAD